MGGQPAGATSALVGASNATELRVAYADMGQWTTVWSSFRVEGDAGPLGVVVPLPEGAFVDQSSEAWFEALEVATAPRVLPPEGLSPYCPGSSGEENPFEVSAATAHTESLLPETIALEADAAGVASWAAGQGLSIDGDLQSKLAGTGAVKFLVVRFNAAAGSSSTPILRVTAPKGLPVLPFSITRAGGSNLRVTAWLFGEGRASFTGTTAANVPGNAIAWNAKTGRSNYVQYRDELLAGDPDRDLLESTGHEALFESTPFGNGEAAIDALVPVYFQRASEYGNALSDPTLCTFSATLAFSSLNTVGPVCPRGDWAALSGPCTAADPAPEEMDPVGLFCGPGADDLALVLAGAVPGETWVTRHTFVIASGASGVDRGVFEGAAPEKLPIVTAAAVDVGDCFGGSGGGSTSSSSGSGGGSTTSSTGSGMGGTSTGSGAGNNGNTGAGNNGSGNSGNWGGYGGADPDPDPNVYIDTSGCSCGAPVDTYETYETYPSSGDDCDSGSSGGDDCDSGSSAGSGDDCDSGSSAGSGDDCDSGSAGGDDCSGDAGSTSDSCGSSSSSSSDCSVSQGAPQGRRRAGPKLSAMTLGLLALVLPLRRRGTRKRREREEQEK